MQITRPFVCIVLVAALSCLAAALGQKRADTVNVRPRVATSQPGIPAVTIAVDRARVPLGEEVTFTVGPASVVRNRQFTITLDFGDGQRQRASETQVVYLYRNTGDYTATVSIAPTNQISIPSPTPAPARSMPSVSLLANPTTAEAPGAVAFVAQLSNQVPNIKYRFVFGDRSPSTDWQDSPQANHTYTSPGTFPAYVDIGVPASGSVQPVGGSKRRAIQITQPRAGPVDLLAEPATVSAGDVVRFTARFASTDPGIVYRFFFGDGSVPSAFQASPQTTHRYASAGIYPAYVEVGRFVSGRFNRINSSQVSQISVTRITATPTPTPRTTPTPTPLRASPTPTPFVATTTPTLGGVSSPTPNGKASPDSGGTKSNWPFDPGNNWWWLLLILLALIAAYQAWKMYLASQLTFKAVTDPGVTDLEQSKEGMGIDFELVLDPNISEGQYELETDEPSFIKSERSSDG